MISLKPADAHDPTPARIRGLRPEMLFALMSIASVCERYGIDCVVTSAVDGVHSRGSRHYSGSAVDIRTRSLDAEKRPSFAACIADNLGEDFDVILERTHLHVEFDPKEP